MGQMGRQTDRQTDGRIVSHNSLLPPLGETLVLTPKARYSDDWAVRFGTTQRRLEIFAV